MRHPQGPVHGRGGRSHPRHRRVRGRGPSASDIVLNLYFGDTRVAQADALFTPERIRYAPPGGPAPGDYFVEVCEFDNNTGPVEPRTYQGTVTLDNTAAEAPYLARWDVFPANPPLATRDADPWWDNPSADTRQRWCGASPRTSVSAWSETSPPARPGTTT